MCRQSDGAGLEKSSENKTAKVGQPENSSTFKKEQTKPASLVARVNEAQSGDDLRSIFKTHLLTTQDRELTEKDVKLIDKVARNITEQVVNFRTHTQPHKEDLRNFMHRAIYEEDRIPRIEKAYIKDWKEKFDKDHIPATERPKVRGYAERVALIEGRLYEQAMRDGKTPPQSHKLNQLACQEFAKNQKLQAKEAKTYQTQFTLSDYAATRMANESLRHQERYGTQPTSKQLETLKAGVQYQEQRMSILQHELKTGLAQDSHRKPNKQDIARINAVSEYIARREFEAFKRHAFETGMPPSSQQLNKLQNDALAEYRQNMKSEVDKLIKKEDKMKQHSKDELSR